MSAIELQKSVLKNSANLKAYYRMESGAELVDSSGNSNTLTAISDPATGVGVFGNGTDLDSNDAYSIVDTAVLKPTGAFTISAWIKTSISGSYRGIFQSYSEAGSKYAGIYMRVSDLNTIQFASGKNSGTGVGDLQAAESTTTVTDGKWYFCVGTWDGLNLRLYINGKCEGTTAWAYAPVYQATNYVRIGNRNIGSGEADFFTGSLDDVFLLNGTALSADQIKELYEGRTVGEGWPQAGLVAGYHLNGNSTDFSGNNNHLTNNNTVLFNQGKFYLAADNGTATNKSLSIASNLGIAGNDSLTMSAWMKMNTEISSGIGIIIQHSSTTTSAKYFQVYYDYNSGTRGLTFDNSGTGGSFFQNITLGTSVWYNICLIRSGTTGLYYLNGNYIGTSSQGSGSATQNILTIGGDGSNGLKGLVDEVQVYNVAKDANWVRKQYALSVGKYL